mmetsp:Transcript_52543/g.94281  ORF Transcript_52543/g.94281 Transcript_52543/m.94281 type:complete len:226 (-) Transcript_52543:9-686(-)
MTHNLELGIKVVHPVLPRWLPLNTRRQVVRITAWAMNFGPASCSQLVPKSVPAVCHAPLSGCHSQGDLLTCCSCRRIRSRRLNPAQPAQAFLRKFFHDDLGQGALEIEVELCGLRIPVALCCQLISLPVRLARPAASTATILEAWNVKDLDDVSIAIIHDWNYGQVFVNLLFHLLKLLKLYGRWPVVFWLCGSEASLLLVKLRHAGLKHRCPPLHRASATPTPFT